MKRDFAKVGTQIFCRFREKISKSYAFKGEKKKHFVPTLLRKLRRAVAAPPTSPPAVGGAVHPAGGGAVYQPGGGGGAVYQPGGGGGGEACPAT